MVRLPFVPAYSCTRPLASSPVPQPLVLHDYVFQIMDAGEVAPSCRLSVGVNGFIPLLGIVNLFLFDNMNFSTAHQKLSTEALDRVSLYAVLQWH